MPKPFTRSSLVANSTVLAAFVGVLFCAGCDSSEEVVQAKPTSHRERAGRRMYDGAPPVIPHKPLSGKCVTCHTETGSTRPPLGFAPANPHLKTVGMSEDSRCKQCHVFQETKDTFQDSVFATIAKDIRGSRAYPGAPPTVPHHQFMREDCAACHSREAARPELRCTHPERARCTQCHVFDLPASETGEKASVGHPTQ